MIRDEEIQRLINYAKGLGLKVTFSSKQDDASAYWTIDNTEIVISKKNNKAKIDTVLSMIHEIGHALDNIYSKERQIDEKIDKAIDHLDEAEELNIDPKRSQRKVILDHERAGTKYWHQIYKETNMKFPVWLLETQMEYDLWQYEFEYKMDRNPKTKEKEAKWKELKKKYRK